LQEASNELPPHQPYNYTIKIENTKGLESLGYSSLHQYLTHELQEIKHFLEENLQRGFIELKRAPFASPVLFVKKPNGTLHFCVDYHKLNNLTCKN
jgi:hypothetical protein